MKGIIFDIQRFSINDGPGIRTTVFLKGCPLNCIWCHNPESKSFKPQLSYDEKKCTLCGKCEIVCEQNVHKVTSEQHFVNFNKCKLCLKCVKACPTNALSIFGREATVDEVLSTVIKDKSYYENSGGGLTISGGEPMSQFDFTYELTKEAKNNNINVAIETSGFGRTKDYEKIAEFVDVFLFDYKATGDELHKKLVGVDRSLINKNFELLLKKHSNIILRCPIIPGYNLSEEHLKNIAQIGKSSSCIKRVELLPYHNFGSGKAKQIGDKYDMENAYVPQDEEVESWINTIKSFGCENVQRG